MSRLPYFDPADAPDSVASILTRTPLGLLQTIAHAQSAFEDWISYSNALLTVLELDPVVRELAILQVAHLERSRYEWVQHVAIGRALGVSDDQIAAIESDEEGNACFSEVHSSTLRFVRQVVIDGAASEDQLAALSAHIGTRGAVELLLVIGHYIGISRLVASIGLEPDDPIAERGPIPGVTT
jgi:alkylhydroperoxidase family enzyme